MAQVGSSLKTGSKKMHLPKDAKSREPVVDGRLVEIICSTISRKDSASGEVL